MTNKEKEVLEIIQGNPLVEQEEIARRLHIKRSTVGVHIASLQKQGYLLGKGYILSQEKYIVGIGAANVDIYGRSHIEIREHYDHPATISSSVGGVTRNVLEIISLLGVKTKLISAIGKDAYGKMIVEHSSNQGIDCNEVLEVEGCSSGLFMQIMDKNNDMHLALCDMSVNQRIDIAYLQSKDRVLRKASALLIDPSLKEDVLTYILNTYGKDIPVFMDPVSDNYAIKMKKFIGKCYACKPNKTELENLSGIKIEKDGDLKKAANILFEKGLQKLYVSLGKKGSAYLDKDGAFYKKKACPLKNIVNASGAGDSFFGAILYSYIHEFDIEKTLAYASAAAKLALQVETPINSEMSIKLIEQTLKENI